MNPVGTLGPIFGSSSMGTNEFPNFCLLFPCIAFACLIAIFMQSDGSCDAVAVLEKLNRAGIDSGELLGSSITRGAAVNRGRRFN